MCPCEEEEETTHHFVFPYKKLRIKERNGKTNKYSGDNWPTTNRTPVNNYSQIVVKFVKSIGFTNFQ